MKSFILTLSLFIMSAAYSADTPKGVGAVSGDPCFCPTCLNNTKCAHTMSEAPRSSGKIVPEARKNAARSKASRGSAQ